MKETFYFKNWSFRFFMALLGVNLLSFGCLLKLGSFTCEASQSTVNSILISGLTNLFLMVGIAMLFFSRLKGEAKDVKYYVSAVGHALFIVWVFYAALIQ
ncbi:membrane hypothetical protein [Tenacibaculum litopenaei]|uniref:hypothetical protein n=1 Tax=Tenacibaculum litopenaei TaxID=396016 RepID=UPI003895EB30